MEPAAVESAAVQPAAVESAAVESGAHFPGIAERDALHGRGAGASPAPKLER